MSRRGGAFESPSSLGARPCFAGLHRTMGDLCGRRTMANKMLRSNVKDRRENSLRLCVFVLDVTISLHHPTSYPLYTFLTMSEFLLVFSIQISAMVTSFASRPPT